MSSETNTDDVVEREFKKWRATKEAEGYQYGYEALSTVHFGFRSGYAAALATPSPQPAPEGGAVLAERERCARIVAGGFPQEMFTYVEPVLSEIRNPPTSSRVEPPPYTCFAPPTEQHATYCPREGMDYDPSEGCKDLALPTSQVEEDSLLDADALLALRVCATCRDKADTWDCPDCFGTRLGPLVHFSSIKNGRPTCIEPNPKVSTDSAEVSCNHCLNVLSQRQNMDMGDWLK